VGKSVDEIMREAESRRMANIGRNSDYISLRSVYHGLFYDRRSREIMDGSGRVILRDGRRADQQQPIVANLLKGIVDDYVALTSQTPDTKVPKPGTEPSDQTFADVVEKYHYGVQHSSRYRLQLKAMAWFHSVLGSSAAVVWPDFRRKHAAIRFIGPDHVYGASDLLDPFAFSSAALIESYSARTIADYFPSKKLRTFIEENTNRRAAWWGEQDRVQIVRWFDQEEVVTILGREVTPVRARKGEIASIEPLVEMGRVQHGLGQCTVVPFQNFLIPGELRSISDIEEAVGLNQFINFLLNAHEEGIKQELFAPLVLIDPDKAPEDIDLSNAMEIIPIRKGGDAKRLQGATNAQQVMSSEMSRSQQLIEYVTGSSAIRTQGRQPSSSIATGRSLEKGQGPQMTRIEYKNDLNAVSLEKVNELSVLMTGTVFETDDVHLFGTHGRSNSLFKMTIKGRDLQGYTYNVVTYPASMYMGMEQRIVAMKQLLEGQHPMVSVRTSMEFIGLVDHPDEELKQIEEDQLRAVAFQRQLQQAASGGGEPQDPLERAVSLESGSTKPAGKSEPLSLPGSEGAAGGAAGQPPAQPIRGAPPVPTEVPSSGLDAPLAEQIEGVIAQARLRGPAYISDQGERVLVTVTSRPDLLKLRRKLGDLYRGRVIVRESKKIPDGAREVSGRGAQGPAE
jgi:hypothetical protein